MDKAKEDTGADICVVVMSGNFVQRGEPAAYDKWTRAAEAVEQGANLVLELPVIYSCNSAEYFAKGGVEILEGLGCVDILAFGSESGELGRLKDAAAILREKEKELNLRIQGFVKEGLSYPKAREMAVSAMNIGLDEDLIGEPNNILAIEYLKQIETLKPFTVKRIGAGHHQSASKIREDMIRDNPTQYQQLQCDLYKLITSKILQTDVESLCEIASADVGLAHKLKKEVRYAETLEQLVERVKSKVYTRTRITRLLIQLLLNIRDEDISDASGYVRVLAFDRQGAKLLKDAKKNNCRLPVITNINKEADLYPHIRATLEKDIEASDIYNLLMGRDLYKYSDYVVRPYGKI